MRSVNEVTTRKCPYQNIGFTCVHNSFSNGHTKSRTPCKFKGEEFECPILRKKLGVSVSYKKLLKEMNKKWNTAHK